MKTPTKILAWHFVASKLRDGRAIPRVGSVLKQSGDIILCENGLHGSVRILDAPQYAPYETKWICRTEHRGVIVEHGNNKLASSERVILWKVEADPILRKFARMCALDVIHLWDAPDIVKKYLKTGKEEYRAAAWAAAGAAAGTAARDASGAAVIAAARAASRAAAVATAGAAAVAASRAAAVDASVDAAWAAARAAQNTRLTRLVTQARKK